MLKRSFAEFHAQKAAPEALQAMEGARRKLAALKSRTWPASYLGTTRDEVEEYFRLSTSIERLTLELQARSLLMLCCV